jgi:hypothetical protein
MPSFANPANLERRADGAGIELADGATPLDFLEAVYRSPTQPMYQRMRAAIEAAQYRHARLAVTATVTTEDFAAMLGVAVRPA